MARGTDEESLDDLRSLRDAYRSLPEYPDFVKIDADAPPAEVLARLTQTIETGRRAQGLVKNSRNPAKPPSRG